MSYKITFYLMSPVVFTDIPVFDSIIAYCMFKQQNGILQNMYVDDEFKLPLKKQDDFYLCSYAIFENKVEFIDRWRKRWDSKYDFYSDFKKAKRRIHTGSGKFKSYDMPMTANYITYLSFYFDTEDVEAIKFLIDNYLVGIGKKVRYGFGWYRGYTIEEVNEEKLLYYRPLPAKREVIKKLMGFKYSFKKSFGAYKVPYWVGENQTEILIPYENN